MACLTYSGESLPAASVPSSLIYSTPHPQPHQLLLTQRGKHLGQTYHQWPAIWWQKKSVHNTTQGEIFCNCLSRLLPFSRACTQFRQSFSALPVFLAAFCFYTPVTLTPHPAYAPRTGVCDQWAKEMIQELVSAINGPKTWSKNWCLRSMGQRHDPESHALSMVSHGQFSSSSARGQSCPLLMSPGQQTQTAREENRSVMMFGDA